MSLRATAVFFYMVPARVASVPPAVLARREPWVSRVLEWYGMCADGLLCGHRLYSNVSVVDEVLAY